MQVCTLHRLHLGFLLHFDSQHRWPLPNHFVWEGQLNEKYLQCTIKQLSGASGKSQRGRGDQIRDFPKLWGGVYVACDVYSVYINRDTNTPPPTVWENDRFCAPPPLGIFWMESSGWATGRPFYVSLNNSVTRPYSDIASHLVKKLSLRFW